MNTWSKVMGDYCVIVPMETLTATNSDRHPTDIAMLRGARMAYAVETEEGRHWAVTSSPTARRRKRCQRTGNAVGQQWPAATF
jgi:hypothetical protein